MRKGILVTLLALFTVFAMVGMVSCGDKGGGSEPEKVTITFNSNGGTFADGTQAYSRQINKGAEIGTLPVPTKSGFELGGWYKEAGFTNIVTSTTRFDATTTLYAKWNEEDPEIDPTEAMIRFDANGGTFDGGSTTWTTAGFDPTDPPADLLDDMPDFSWAGHDFIGWYDAATDGTEIPDDFLAPLGVLTTVYAYWEEVEPEPLEIIEKVSLANGAYVVYRFDLPEGRTWEDYAKLTVDYMVDDATTWSGSDTAGGTRLHGNYTRNDFTFVDITVGSSTDPKEPKAIASYNADKNTKYTLDQGKTSWGTVAGFAGNWDGELGEYFTAEYDITGANKFTGAPPYVDANKPAGEDTGPFYFALGISNRNGNPFPGTVQYIRNVTLVGVIDGMGNPIPSVIATPAIFEDEDGVKYPAFIGYPDTSGGNGSKSLTRELISGPSEWEGEYPTIPVTFTTYTITKVPSYPTDSTGGTAISTTAETDRNGLLTEAQLAPLDKVSHVAKGFYNFKGWYTAASAGSQVTTNYSLTGNVSIYGQWELVQLPTPIEPLVINDPEFGKNGETTPSNTWDVGSGGGLFTYKLPDEAFLFAYDTLTLYYTISDVVAGDLDTAGKLIMKPSATGANDWGGISGYNAYVNIEEDDFDWSCSMDIPGFKFLNFQDNSGAVTYTITVTGIKFSMADEIYAVPYVVDLSDQTLINDTAFTTSWDPIMILETGDVNVLDYATYIIEFKMYGSDGTTEVEKAVGSLIQMKFFPAVATSVNDSNAISIYNVGDPYNGGTEEAPNENAIVSGKPIKMPTIPGTWAATDKLKSIAFQRGNSANTDVQFLEITSITFYPTGWDHK
jgi:uncharacterized repeat protein (TIGR02543 family)